MHATLRALIRARGFSIAIVCTLGLPLAAAAALFSAADALLIRALPYQEPDRLAAVFETQPRSGARALASIPNFLALKDLRSFAGLAAFRPWGFVLTGSGDAERLTGARVTANLLPVLGVRLHTGRAFAADEDVHGGPRVAIVSHALWQRLGAPPDLTGRRLVLNGAAHDVVGVLPPGFRMPFADVLVPYGVEPFALSQRGNRVLTVVGRLADGSTMEQARAELNDAARRLDRQSENTGWGLGVTGLADDVSGGFRPTLLMLAGAVAFVLLIASANAAGLTAVRMDARSAEFATYRALGAGPWWVARRLLLESTLLGLAAAGLGVALAAGFLRLLVAAAPPELSRLVEATVDLRVAAFALLLAIAASALAAAPAIYRTHGDISAELRAGRSSTRARTGVSRASLACQVALSAAVLLGAGLLLRSFQRVAGVDAGFDPARVLTLSLSPDARYAEPARRAAFFETLLARCAALPGVDAAGIVSHTPLAGAPLTADVAAQGGGRATDTADLASYTAVSPDWFRAMGIPLRLGRTFGPSDRPGGQPVVILSDNLARSLWPGADPLGRQVIVGATIGADTSPRTVVGIVGDVRVRLERDAPFQVYVPYSQNPWPTMSLAVRTAGDPAALAAAVRGVIGSIDRGQAAYNIRPMTAIVNRALAARRFQALIVSLFALAAALLACCGVYAVVAYDVALRTREIGIRLALGARPSTVMVASVAQAFRASMAGLAAGCAIAAVVARALAGQLFGISPADPSAYAGAAALILILVVSVSVLAARKALQVDPATALRGM